MLALSRRAGESVLLIGPGGYRVRLKITRVRRATAQVRLAIDAPPEIIIRREDATQRVLAEAPAVALSSAQIAAVRAVAHERSRPATGELIKAALIRHGSINSGEAHSALARELSEIHADEALVEQFTRRLKRRSPWLFRSHKGAA